MVELLLKVINHIGDVICESKGYNFVDLVCKHEYEEGDCIVLETSEKNIHLNIQVDDALGKSLVYLAENLTYHIPFGKRRVNRSPKVFSGNVHYLYVEVASEHEVKMYRNLALNQNDQHCDVKIYPHASANVETRGEAVFAAQNAIDGVRANLSHGNWPYGSWGINRQDDAEIRIDFGRTVKADKVVLYTRADFPHDNWWTQVKLVFSDGSEIVWDMEKSILPHELHFEEKEITWVVMKDMIKADDPSPFPALTQFEVYGTEKL